MGSLTIEARRALIRLHLLSLIMPKTGFRAVAQNSSSELAASERKVTQRVIYEPARKGAV